ncbi:hypothetical protein BC939DRAFT_449455 [Gamsiella multidivaricata]|uniref:uncharacterized protein n=1 Tax=Gamsiella multidivaricata TaxID=101098 RepID=UPI00221E4413|nr:uncharacterized protein BC939DRAFT_449455 [Gamsiella multidivaricata]KAI7824864.1 hypothetical protein BC939DRAFT_449455 [Gamsiella multidivaricata]
MMAIRRVHRLLRVLLPLHSSLLFLHLPFLFSADNSGRRINELSALLSRHGISIFYLSTRITDFVLVKEKRLKSVLPTIRALFSLSVDSECDLSSRGFTSESEQGSYPGSSFTSMNSFLHTPSSPSRVQSVHYQYPNHNGSYTSSYQQPLPGFYGSSFSNSCGKPSTEISIPFDRRPNYGYGHYAGPPPRGNSFFGAPGRQNSDSDSSSTKEGKEGTDGDGGSGHSMTSPSGSHMHHSSKQRGRQPSLPESSFGEGIGRYFPKRRPHGSSYDSFDSLSNPITGDGFMGSMNAASGMENSLHIQTTFRGRDVKGAVGTGENPIMFPPLTPISGSYPTFGSFQSMGLMQETSEEQDEREANIKEQIRKSCPRSVIDDKLFLAGLSLDYQNEWAVTLLKVLFYPEELPGPLSNSKARFISFTTTDEGTSLIADQEVLGQFEDHMLNMSSSETMLRCIQVDLSTFGLDTYGLVYLMSNPLVDHSVNLLCLSTFRTANVLVHDSDLDKSLKILSMA